MNRNLKLCQTCLATDRKLFPIVNLEKLLTDVRLWKQVVPNGGICWECKSIVMKFFTFKSKVFRAQLFLGTGDKVPQLFKLTSLVKVTKLHYNFEFQHEDKSLNIIDLIESDNEDQEMDANVKPPASEGDHQAKVAPASDAIDQIDNKITVELDTFASDDIYSPEAVNIVEINTMSITELVKNKELVLAPKTIPYYNVDNKFSTSSKSELDKDKLKDKFDVITLSDGELEKFQAGKRNEPKFKKMLYKCDICVLGFIDNDSFNKHLARHDESAGEYECKVCKVRYSDKDEEERHRLNHYRGFKCKLCRYCTTEELSALNHCSIHGRDTVDCIHCFVCERLFGSPQQMDEHLTALHPNCCDVCCEDFGTEPNLEKHKERKHGVKLDFECELCKRTFKTKYGLGNHMGKAHANVAKSCFCKACEVQFENKKQFHIHLATCQKDVDKTYNCDKCKKKFISKLALKRHYDFEHLNKSSYKCDTCNKLFESSWLFQKHCKSMHPSIRSRDYPCEICGKKFFENCQLISHQLIHSEARTFICSECGDTFKQSAALYNHTRLVHKGFKIIKKSK